MGMIIFQKLKTAFHLFIFSVLLTNPIFGDGDSDYAQFLSSLENLENKKFTNILIDELKFYIHRFPNASNLDDMHFKLATIYADHKDDIYSFVTHLEFIYLYPNSKHLTTVKDKLRGLLIQKNKYKPLKDKVETILNPVLDEPGKEYRYYSFIKDLYNYHFEPAARLLILKCDELVKNYPESEKIAEVMFWKAELLAQDKKYEQALNEYMKLTFIFNKSLYVTASKLKMADLFTERLKMHQNAILTLEEFLLEYPDDPQAALAQYRMGQIIQKEKKKYIEAINAYTAVAKRYPASVEAVPALFEAANLYEDKFKEYDQAIRIYNEVVRDFKDDLQAPYALAEAARIYEKRLKDYFNASAVYIKIQGIYPDSKIAAEALYAAAEINEKKLENNERALKYYRLIVDKYPEDKIASKASKKIERLSKE